MTSTLRFSFGLACAVISATGLSAAQAAAGAVTVAEDDAAFTLANGIVTARVSKKNGDLLSLQYRGTETLAFNSGHSGGYWSHDTTGGTQLLTKVTIDPKANGGERGEVSVKGISGGRKMGHGPGAAQGGDFPADIEIRYTLGRGDSGVYTSCTFDHLPGYPAATMTEANMTVASATTWSRRRSVLLDESTSWPTRRWCSSACLVVKCPSPRSADPIPRRADTIASARPVRHQ